MRLDYHGDLTDKIERWLTVKIAREFMRFFIDAILLWFQLIARIKTTIREHFCDKRLGIITTGHSHFSDNLSLYRDGSEYQPVPYEALEKAVKYLQATPEDVFVDLGCGKGRAIFLAATQKLKKVIGVELRKDMIDIAFQNLKNFKSQNTPVEIIEADAAAFVIKEGSIFFMNESFGNKTLAKVFDNLNVFLRNTPPPTHTQKSPPGGLWRAQPRVIDGPQLANFRSSSPEKGSSLCGYRYAPMTN